MNALDTQAVIVIFLCALVLFGPKNRRRLGEDTAKALQEFSQERSHVRPPDPIDLATLVPVCLCGVLMLALIWLTAQH